MRDPLTGRLLKNRDYLFVENMIDMKKVKSPWVVIGQIIKYWKESNPTEYRSVIIEIDETRESQLKSTGASNSNALRHLVDIPEKVFSMITVLYRDDPSFIYNDRSFYREFAKRFREFAVAEKL